MRKELQGSEEFDEAIAEEIRLSSAMELPLYALSVMLPDDPDGELTRLLLDKIRMMDMATTVSPEELAIVLPNTTVDGGRLVADRLIAAVPGAEVGEAAYSLGDTPATLLGRARENLAR